ncbi:hypothetical protein D3C71_1780610 [compost metagenome]
MAFVHKNERELAREKGSEERALGNEMGHELKNVIVAQNSLCVVAACSVSETFDCGDPPRLPTEALEVSTVLILRALLNPWAIGRLLFFKCINFFHDASRYPDANIILERLSEQPHEAVDRRNVN